MLQNIQEVAMKKLDLAGQRFGKLTAIERIGGPLSKWRLICDCGNETVVQIGNLRNGHTRSCGCHRHDGARSVTHGHERGRKASRTLKSYRHAKDRCLNASNPKYPRYGGRGIVMCQKWAESFSAFLDDMGECPPGMTIDRIDNDGDYEPSNCRWATAAQQSRNKSNNVWIEHAGERLVLTDYAAAIGISVGTAKSRITQGRTIEKVAQIFKR
jgi:hypothetical protein